MQGYPTIASPPERFVHRVLIAGAVAAALVLLFVGTAYLYQPLLLMLAGILGAVFFHAIARAIRYTLPSRRWSIVLAIVGTLGATGVILSLTLPYVATEFSSFRRELPNVLETLRQRFGEAGWVEAVIADAERLYRAATQDGELVFRAFGVASTILGVLGGALLTLVLAIYLALDPWRYRDGFVALFPLGRRPRVTEVMNRLGDTLHWWLLGRLSAMLLVLISTWIGLWALGVPFHFPLAVLAGVLGWIPNFGPILSAIPAVLLGLIEGSTTALYVIALYVGIQTVESYLISPLIQEKAVKIPPVLLIVFQLAVGILMGGFGLALATPLLACLLVIIKMLYIRDLLGDDSFTT